MLRYVKLVLQWWNGDVAYARYLAHQTEHHPEATPLDRRAFYAAELDRKWSGISRCC